MKNLNCWEVVNAVAAAARLLLLFGPPGTGKTHAAQRAGSPGETYTVTITPETPAAELRGHYIPRGGEFVWQDGPAVKAWREGARLVLNEIDHAGGDCISLLLALLDNRESAQMTLPSGETVRPAPGFQVIATMNGKPQDLLPALADRFAASIEILEPHPEAFQALPVHLRNAAAGSFAGSPESRITLRSWLQFAELIRSGVAENAAAACVFGKRAEDVLASLKIAGAS